MKSLFCLILTFLSIHHLYSQKKWPVLKTNNRVISIKDGDLDRKNYWHIDPKLEIDIYVADKTNHTKNVSFYSEIDTMTFDLSPAGTYDFIVILNEKDSCFTQLKSGINPINTELKLKSDTIPFRLTKDNNLIIETIINEVDTLDLMFHTAENAISITEKAALKLKSINFNKSSIGNSWGGNGTNRYSTNNSFRVNNFEWKDLTLWSNKLSGPSSDGKFGPNLFHDKVIEFDFENKIMVIHSRLPRVKPSFNKTDLIFNQDWMYLEIELMIDQKKLKHKAMIHSGYGGNILLDDVFAQENKLNKKLKISESNELKDSYGNKILTQKAIVPECIILNETFTNLPISFFEGAIGKRNESIFGGNLIKRFNWYFDMQTATIYYKANELMNLPMNK